MRRVTGSGASTAAESSSLQRTRSTSAGRSSVYPPSGDTVRLFLICKSAEKFDLRDRKVAGSSARRRRLLRCSGVNRTVFSPPAELSCVPELDAGT